MPTNRNNREYEIPLTQGKVARVCSCHYPLVKNYKWLFDGRYASRSMWIPRTKSHKKVYMHKIIKEGEEIDHVNRNKLDNRCLNLRETTRSKNLANVTSRISRWGYKGVAIQKNGRFSARVFKDGKWYCCGTFDTAKEAARVYNAKASELFGEFAGLNYVD